MEISIFFLIVIILVAAALGWLARSYYSRTKSAQVREVDDFIKTKSDAVEEAAKNAYSSVKKRVD